MEAKITRIPWPGPRPYKEKDWKVFVGRSEEVQRVSDKMHVQRLTILAGGSGTGKTSLLRAGIIPIIRLRRYHQRGGMDEWPLLLLRRWSVEREASIEESLKGQIEGGIKAIEDWGRREGDQQAERALGDAEFLRNLVAENAELRVVQLIEALAYAEQRRTRALKGGDAESGLVLILDQFEELLRAEGAAAEEALAIVRDLYRSAAPLRIVVSMRKEYLYAVKPLEQISGGLSGRTVLLESLPESKVLQVLAEVSRRSEIRFETDVGTQIVKWLGRRGGELGAELNDATGGDHSDGVDESVSKPDLLRLQAVLREVSQFAAKQGEDTITSRLLGRFTALYGGDEARIVGGALERWIETAIQEKIEIESSDDDDGSTYASDSYASWSELGSVKDLLHQVRRTAIRIGPHLSSMDYKVPQEENALLRAALGEDIWRLGLKDPKLREQIRIIDGEPPSLSELGLSTCNDGQERNILSSVARRKGWSPARTGDQLAIVFRETLHRLAKANVLTPTIRKQHGKEIRIWELVHDQFGPPFTAWSREHKDTWDDCVHSLVVTSGVQPIAVPVAEFGASRGQRKLEFRDLTWQGCGVEPGKSERLAFRDVFFRDCFFVGTIFDRCDFFGGGFVNCQLDGGLFRDCGFFLGDEGSVMRFELCDASSLAIVGGKLNQSVIECLEFRNCELRQPTIDRTSLRGEVRFTQESRVVQGFFNVAPEEESRVRVLFEGGTGAFHCSASQARYGYLELHEDELKFNRALPDGFWRRRGE